MINFFYTASLIFLLSLVLMRSNEINTVIKFVSSNVEKVIDIFYLK